MAYGGKSIFWKWYFQKYLYYIVFYWRKKHWLKYAKIILLSCADYQYVHAKGFPLEDTCRMIHWRESLYMQGMLFNNFMQSIDMWTHRVEKILEVYDWTTLMN